VAFVNARIHEIVAKQVYYSLHYNIIRKLNPSVHSIFLPSPDNRDAMKRVFPPGAAQQSTIVSPGCGSTQTLQGLQ